MKPVLLDTCAIIYLFTDKEKMSESVFSKIEKSSYILSISFAEIACKMALGRLTLGRHSVQDLLIEISETDNFELINITPQMWIDTVTVKWDGHKDPVDRMLVSFATKQDLEIVTSDMKIQQIYSKCII